MNLIDIIKEELSEKVKNTSDTEIIVEKGTELYHGTIEEFNKEKAHVGGYDQLFWTTTKSSISQTYIPTSGFLYTDTEHFSMPTDDKYIQETQRQLGITYDYSKVKFENHRATSYPEANEFKEVDKKNWNLKNEAYKKYEEFKALEKQIDAKHWKDQTDKELEQLTNLEKEYNNLYIEAEKYDSDVLKNNHINKKLEELGYKNTGVDSETRKNYRWKLKFDNNILQPADYKAKGRLLIVIPQRDLKIYDTTDRGRREGDLMDLDYHKHDWFKTAENGGYDGIKINDFAQSSDMGNIGHTSIGLFKNTLKDVKIEEIEARHHELEPHYQSGDWQSQEYKKYKNIAEINEIINEEVFLFENPNQAIKFLKGKKLDPAINPKGKQIFNTITGLTRGDGYTYLLTLFMVNEKMPFNDIKKLYEFLKQNKDLINKLPKPAVTYQTYRELRNALTDLESMTLTKKLYNQLPSSLKKQFNILEVKEKQEFKELAGKYNILNPEQQKFFTSKITGFKDIRILMDSLKNYIIAIENGEDFNSIKKKIENTPDTTIIYADPNTNIIIAHIISFDASKKLGCTTKWCITKDMARWREYKQGGNKYFYIWDFNYSSDNINYMVGVAYNPKQPERSRTHLKDDKQTNLPTIIDNKHLNYDIFNNYLEKYNAEQALNMSAISGLFEALKTFNDNPEKLVDVVASSEFIREYGNPENVYADRDSINLDIKKETFKNALDLGDEFDYIYNVANSYSYDGGNYDTHEADYMYSGLNSDNMALIIDLAKKLGVPKKTYNEFPNEDGAIVNFLEKYDLEDISNEYINEYSQARDTAEQNEANKLIEKVPFDMKDASFKVSEMISYINDNNIIANNFDELIDKIKENLPEFNYESISNASYEDMDLDALNKQVKNDLEKAIDAIENDENHPLYIKAQLIKNVTDEITKLGFTLTNDEKFGYKEFPDKTITINDAAYEGNATDYTEEKGQVMLNIILIYNNKFFEKKKIQQPKDRSINIPLSKLKNYINQYEIPYIDEARLRNIIAEEMFRLKTEGVGDIYGEKEFNIPDPAKEQDRIATAGIKDIINGEYIGTIRNDKRKKIVNTNVFINPRSLQNFESDVRAITDKEGNLFIAQRNQDFYHTEIADVVNNTRKYNVGAAYDEEDYHNKMLWHRIGTTNNFGLSISYMDYFQDRRNMPIILKLIQTAKTKNPKYNFLPQLWNKKVPDLKKLKTLISK